MLSSALKERERRALVSWKQDGVKALSEHGD